MARTHNMNAFMQLVQDNNMCNITWELGNSKQYIKTLFYKGMPIVSNCQQYNMSGRSSELFEILQANMSTLTDESMATSKVEHAHRRGEYNLQARTYVKDKSTIELLEDELSNIRDEIDFITDDDLKSKIEMGSIVEYINNLKIDYSNDLEFVKQFQNDWNSEKGQRANQNDWLLVAPNRVAMKGVWAKVQKIEQRARELMGA